ncbi:M14 family metallopeptidase [Streptomyces sp. NPDC058534]|uniref:M14 family metallopeptidase n=1 Tax=Streptomyces sp. NPDC058534 TaxID=3346541 RepID=UPI00365BFEB2
MRLPTRGRRTTTVAGALLVVALTAPFAAEATESDTASPSGRAQKSVTADAYEVTGVRTAAERTALVRTGASIETVGDDSVVITADARVLDTVRARGYRVAPLAAPARKGKPQAGDFPAGDTGYHTYAEMTTAVDQAITAHPDIVSKRVIGTSYEGRDLIAVKISDNVSADEDEPEVLFTHHQHASEHMTVEMALYLIDEFSSKYGSDQQVTTAVDGREIWIVPDANPDGGAYDISGGQYRWWRKNRQPTPGTSYVGTDLNRNWAFKWGCCSGSGDQPYYGTYRGPAAESAPETQALADFVRSRVVGGRQQITAAIDFHTAGRLVMWPWGWTQDATTDGMTQDDADAYAAIGDEMAAGNGYTPQKLSALYTSDGSIADWLWGDQKIFAFAIELYPSGPDNGHYPPDEAIGPETAMNRGAVLKLLGNADCVYRAIGKETLCTT